MGFPFDGKQGLATFPFMSKDQKPIRVRFAPSPTGYLHVGGARTAIYNYFFAKAMGGQFLLRIEDTDRKRYNESALQDLIRDLKWLGLHWDEGPEVGGDSGPFHQSERLPLYHQHVQQLVDQGHAYHCFCTEERLQEIRAVQEKNNQLSGYDRHCRNLNPAEVAQRLAAGEKSVVRLKVPLDGITTFQDHLRGTIEYQNKQLDDLVLLKRDGFPTYHLASVVDDHAMGITHILRGDEWLSSTPKHQLLYQAFAWDPPVFCHLPVILAAGGGKLSKRKGAASVGDFQEQGYLPQTLVNYLALLGWNPGDDREVMDLQEMIDAFTLDRISPKSVSFDEKKLAWMNGQHIQKLSLDVFSQALTEALEQAGITQGDHNPQRIRSIAAMMQARTKFMTDLAENVRYFFEPPQQYDEKAQRKAWGEGSRSICIQLRQALSELPDFHTETLEQLFHQTAEEMQLNLGKLVHPIRLAVSGVAGGPGLFELLAVLGQQEVIQRIEAAEPLMS